MLSKERGNQKFTVISPWVEERPYSQLMYKTTH